MAISISGPSAAAPSSIAAPSSLPSSSFATGEPTQKASTPADTVKLSQSGQVHLLKQQGQTTSQIARNLSIPVAAVDGYLGIQAPKVVTTPTQPSTQASENAAKTPQPPSAAVKG